MRFLRIMRGALGSAISWGVAWVPLTLLAFGIIALFGGRVPAWNELALVVSRFAILGAISGAVFAVVLAVVARRRTFAQITLPRMLVCGAVGGMLLPAAMSAMLALRFPDVANSPGRVVAQLLFTGVLGGVSALASLYVARRAPTLDDSAFAELASPHLDGRDLTRVAASMRSNLSSRR